MVEPPELPASGPETLGHMLVTAGVITRAQLHDAMRLQRQNQRLLGTCLLSLGYIEGDTLLHYTAQQLEVPALPPGSLQWAAPEAVQRVPQEMALRLRIVPYSFSNETQILALAVADARVLEQLAEVAQHCACAIGAYVALEMEVESALGRLYGYAQVAPELALPAPLLPGRLRPMRAETLRPIRPQVPELPSQNFGKALGLKPPVLLRKVRPPSGDVEVQPEPLLAPDLPVMLTGRVAMPPLERMSLYDTVERIYQVQSADEVGAYVVRACLNYFERTLALTLKDRRLTLLAYGGHPLRQTPPSRSSVALEAVPEVIAGLGRRKIAYGARSRDARAAEICDMFGLSESPTSFIAPIDSETQMCLLIYADNADRPELYDDLHDIEMLFKEAETAMGMLFS